MRIMQPTANKGNDSLDSPCPESDFHYNIMYNFVKAHLKNPLIFVILVIFSTTLLLRLTMGVFQCENNFHAYFVFPGIICLIPKNLTC